MRSKKKCFRAAGEGRSAVRAGEVRVPRGAANISSLSRTGDEPDTWKGGRQQRGRALAVPRHRSQVRPSCDALSVAGVTILLSQTVFSLLVAHVITQTSDAVPLIG